MRLARRQLLLQVRPARGVRALRSRRVVRELIEWCCGDAAIAQSPTRPVRLMSVSSMSSIVVIVRAEAW